MVCRGDHKACRGLFEVCRTWQMHRKVGATQWTRPRSHSFLCFLEGSLISALELSLWLKTLADFTIYFLNTIYQHLQLQRIQMPHCFSLKTFSLKPELEELLLHSLTSNEVGGQAVEAALRLLRTQNPQFWKHFQKYRLHFLKILLRSHLQFREVHPHPRRMNLSRQMRWIPKFGI